MLVHDSRVMGGEKALEVNGSILMIFNVSEFSAKDFTFFFI